MKAHDSRMAKGKLLSLVISLLPAVLLLLPVMTVRAGAVFTLLHSFSGPDGAMPLAGLVLARDGNLYGTTIRGGTNGVGTVFQAGINGGFASQYAFAGADGAYPLAELMQGTDGYLHGTTTYGGANTNQDILGDGTVFVMSTNGVLTTVSSCSDEDANPWAGLIQSADGKILGATLYGGGFDDGTLVSSDGTNDNFGPVLSFSGSFAGGIYGQRPTSTLVQDGSFYGTSEGDWLADGDAGTFGGAGTVFSFNPDTLEGPQGSVLYFFGSVTDASGNILDGFGPNGLVVGSDGKLYGTTSGGGTNGAGTIFQLTTNGVLTRLYSFTGTNDGNDPDAALVQGAQGTLFGTTYGGGSAGNGTVFAINPDGTGFKILHNFSAGGLDATGIHTNSDGANPVGALILAGSTLYGTTSAGGGSGDGTVFRLALSGPALTLTLAGTNAVLSWSTNDCGFALEFTTSLAPPVRWSSSATPVVIVGGQNRVTNALAGAQRFFRLDGD